MFLRFRGLRPVAIWVGLDQHQHDHDSSKLHRTTRASKSKEKHSSTKGNVSGEQLHHLKPRLQELVQQLQVAHPVVGLPASIHQPTSHPAVMNETASASSRLRPSAHLVQMAVFCNQAFDSQARKQDHRSYPIDRHESNHTFSVPSSASSFTPFFSFLHSLARYT